MSLETRVSILEQKIENVVEPLASETVGMVFAPASKPEMQLLHVFECYFVQ